MKFLIAGSVACSGCGDRSEESAARSAAPGRTSSGDSRAPEREPSSAAETPVDEQALSARVGVEPGPVTRTEGASAVLVTIRGRVELRRLGEELFAEAASGTRLGSGDQLRTAEAASAGIVFADSSSVEVAEDSVLAIGSRVAMADPASSAAVLSGVARFSAAPRAPGEGPFLVSTPAGVIATKGTVFAVGVAADGAARVGVESGSIEVAGSAALDRTQTIESESAVELAAAGTLGAGTSFQADDWGEWRDRIDAQVDVAATAKLHAEAMAAIDTELEADYAALHDLAKQVASFETSAAARAQAGDDSAYAAGLPDTAAAIEASFLLGLRMELLTHAYASHATLASELHIRHPELVKGATLAPRVGAAVLWPKRLDATALAYFEPLRVQYYLHHPRGRAHAALVGVSVPELYAKVNPASVLDARAKLKGKVFLAPSVAASAVVRPVWIAAPSAQWHAKARFAPAKPRGQAGWWVRPPSVRANALFGCKAKTKLAPVFPPRAPEPRGRLKARWDVALGTRTQLAAPDLPAAARAQAAWKAQSGKSAAAHAHHGLETSGEAPKGRLKNAARFDAQAKANVEAQKTEAKAKLDTSDAAERAKANVGTRVHAGANIHVKPLTVEPPKAKAKAKAGGQVKIGR